jgi:hypothetical protein
MKKFRLLIEENGEACILFLSVVSLFTGILLSLILVFKNIFLKYIVTDIEIKFIIILIAGGLLGSVLDFVLKKHLKDYVEKYIDQEKIESILAELLEKNLLLKEEQEIKAEEDEISPNNELDTVIVPVARTYASVIANKEYKCPYKYAFKKDLKYIAFYKDKKVLGYGELDSNYNLDIGGEKIFKFKNYTERTIPHELKGAYVQNKVYCKMINFIKAKTTADIRPEI